MIIDDPHSEQSDDCQGPTQVIARRLLFACIKESERQALSMKDLDRTLGSTIAIAHQPEKVADFFRNLSSDLQKADIIRQELEGLSRVLDLLWNVETLDDRISNDRIYCCTPLVDMRRRLLNLDRCLSVA